MLRSTVFRNSRAFVSELAVTKLPLTIRDLQLNPPQADTEVVARGHIKSVRTGKTKHFLDISDGTLYHPLNVVVHVPEGEYSNEFRLGQSVEVKGKWVISKGHQDYEILLDPCNPNQSLKLIGDVTDLYPIQKKSQTFPFLRLLPTLRHRTVTMASILRCRSFVEEAVMKYFSESGFTKVLPPLITSSDCEGAGEMFKITPANPTGTAPFFGKEAYLTVSTQLHLEVLAPSLNRVWTLSPCFRAENSNTSRHLSEFWMLEAEMCYVDKVSDLTQVVEALIRSVATDLKTNANKLKPGSLDDLLGSRYNGNEQTIIKERIEALLTDEPWPVITYTQAIDILNNDKNKNHRRKQLKWGDSILTDNEKWLAGKHFQSPVFITDYPADQKPFYMPPSAVVEADRPTVACFDLIIPEFGELVGGSLREHRYNELLAEIQRRNMLEVDMKWYLSTRSEGTVPHGGFGLGFERLIAYLAGLENIKDVATFPRAPDTCDC